MFLNIFFIILGFVLLVKGGDWLVDGAAAIARRMGLSSMVIGLTVLGFGTSAPELLVSLQAAIAGSSGLSLGNVIGSNIANIGLILGATALITVCPARSFTLKVELPLMLLSMLGITAAINTGCVSRWAGAIGMFILVGFITVEVILSRRQSKNNKEGQEDTTPLMPSWRALLLIIVGLIMLVYGADRLIAGATSIAQWVGNVLNADPKNMERIIGLTIVAVGTSLPELFASIMAARKGDTDMAIGNVIGSVTFNILCGIGLTAIICPITNIGAGVFNVDLALMLVLGILLWIFLRTRHLLERWEGAVLLLIYVGYIASLAVA